MNSEFLAHINELPKLFETLNNADFVTRDNLRNIPESGIYVLYEDNKPIYVGRSNRMKERILEHSRPSATHNSAPFAFNLAKEKAQRIPIEINVKRDELEKNPYFVDLFKEAKLRVYKMRIKVIGIDDQILQTLFEVYASLELETTQYNDFRTH